MFFFVALRWAPRPFGGARAKKKHHPGCFFFAPAPGKAGEGEARCWPGCFFCCGPFFARAPRHWFLENFLLSAPGVQSVVFFVALRWAPRPFGGARAKKKYHPGCFFFAAAPRGRSLTHCGPGWRCLPLAGVVFVVFAAGRGRTGVVFFFLLWPRPDAHSLTVGWGDFGKARVVFFFFLLRPRRVFLDNNKKCLGYYIGSKKTRRGHSKKKKPLPGLNCDWGRKQPHL